MRASTGPPLRVYPPSFWERGGEGEGGGGGREGGRGGGKEGTRELMDQ